MEVNRLPLWTEEEKRKHRIQEMSPVQVTGLVHSTYSLLKEKTQKKRLTCKPEAEFMNVQFR